MRAALRRAALLWVNHQRAHCGMPAIAELPVGSCGDAYNCPVARGLSGVGSHKRYVTDVDDGFARVSYTTLPTNSAWSGGGWAYVPLPPNVKEFVTKFDNGEYEDLIEDDG